MYMVAHRCNSQTNCLNVTGNFKKREGPRKTWIKTVKEDFKALNSTNKIVLEETG